MRTKFLTGLVFAVLFFTNGCMAEGPGGASAAVQGQTAPDFELKDLNRMDVRLSTVLAGNKAVLLNFWATWCPPCREEIPDLIRLQERLRKDGFAVLAIDVGESHTKASAFAAKIGINYPVLLDTDMTVTLQYKVVGIPTSYLIGRDGKLLGVYHAVTQDLVADVEKALK